MDKEMTEPGTSSHARKAIPAPDVLAELPADGGGEFNRLVFEQSPYLLQHAANPVDWYPWGDEAFEKARKEDKAIFLSIGYTTCHWCHVMERESFEDDEVAALMNQYFVCVKVDREERPDVDKIYMDVTQAMTGGGGWPMTVVLTPDLKPFFAGTYFPKQSLGNRPGMMQLLPGLADAWKNKRTEIEASADQAVNAMRQMNAGAPSTSLPDDLLPKAYQQLASNFDQANGGFSKAPKFPTPHNISFLLRYRQRAMESQALNMVAITLSKMRQGGLFDQLGFGFHRYATDSQWRVPHFEKMLYDQALHIIAYAEAYQATGNELYADTAREVIEYVQRDLTAPGGAFYSAEDADSEGEEGKFYLWTMNEIIAAVGPIEADLLINAFTITPDGNFRDEATGQKNGKNHLYMTRSLAQMAQTGSLDEDVLSTSLEASRLTLLAARGQRVRPQLDNKILTDWNGLMIVALAKAAVALDDPSYAEASRRGADFILGELRDEDGHLLKRYRSGKAGLPAGLDDYAFMAWGLLELYEATFEIRYLEAARDLSDRMLARFWDDRDGGLFMADDRDDLLVRGKEIHDGAIPSGNSVAALTLAKLARLTGHTAYEDKAWAIVKAFGGHVAQWPSNYCLLLQAVDFLQGPTREIVLVGSDSAEGMSEMVKTVRQGFSPNKVVLRQPGGEEGQRLSKIVPFVEYMTEKEGRATAYVCENFTCEQPVTDVDALRNRLIPDDKQPTLEP